MGAARARLYLRAQSSTKPTRQHNRTFGILVVLGEALQLVQVARVVQAVRGGASGAGGTSAQDGQDDPLMTKIAKMTLQFAQRFVAFTEFT